jgi:hypothetical protein
MEVAGDEFDGGGLAVLGPLGALGALAPLVPDAAKLIELAANDVAQLPVP